MFEQVLNPEPTPSNSVFSLFKGKPWAARIEQIFKKKTKKEPDQRPETAAATEMTETERLLTSAEKLLPKLAIEAQLSLLNSVDLSQLRNDENFNPFQPLYQHVRTQLKSMGLGQLATNLAMSAVDEIKVSDLFPSFYYYQKADDYTVNAMIALSKERLLSEYASLSVQEIVKTLLEKLSESNVHREKFNPQEIVTIVEQHFDKLAIDYRNQLSAMKIDQTVIENNIQFDLKPKVVKEFGRVFVSQFLKRS